MLVAANPYHIPLPHGSRVILTNIPPNFIPSQIILHDEYNNNNNNINNDKNKRSNEETDILVQKALHDAWEQYGPPLKTKQRLEDKNLPLGSWRLPQGYLPTKTQMYQQQNYFQPYTSEWDQRMTTIPKQQKPIQEPGMFSRLLSKYLELEVNHHEITDFIRRAVFGFLVGILIIGWIILGVSIGFIPIHIFGSNFVKRDLDGKIFSDTIKYNNYNNKYGGSSGGGGGSSSSSSDGGGDNEFSVRNDIMREITERIFLALDGDWLIKLEQKVKKGSNSRWLKTHVHCCIMPDDKARGTAECQLIRKARKVSSPFKCLSDLIYDIQFGPSDTVISQFSDTSTSSSTSTSSFNTTTTTTKPTQYK